MAILACRLRSYGPRGLAHSAARRRPFLHSCKIRVELSCPQLVSASDQISVKEYRDGQRHLVVAFGHSPADNPAPALVLALIMENRSRTLDDRLYPVGTQIESGNSAVTWPAIMAGSVAAIALTLILLSLGSGFGLAGVSPWPGVGATPATFTIAAGIWLIVTQWMASAIGGYLAGRLRTRWNNLHTDEVFFRDTAHGLLTWATATLIVTTVAVLSTALTSGSVDTGPITAQAADAARKVASSFAIFGAISMLIGAFVASAAAAYGGHLRDRHP